MRPLTKHLYLVHGAPSLDMIMDATKERRSHAECRPAGFSGGFPMVQKCIPWRNRTTLTTFPQACCSRSLPRRSFVLSRRLLGIRRGRPLLTTSTRRRQQGPGFHEQDGGGLVAASPGGEGRRGAGGRWNSSDAAARRHDPRLVPPEHLLQYLQQAGQY